MDKLDQQHFVYSIVISCGLIVCLATKTIDGQLGSSMLSIIIGYYLGKQGSMRTDQSANSTLGASK